MTAAVVCDHCGLPVPADLVDPGAGRYFCCSGCRVAYEVIHGAGLDGDHELRSRLAAPERPVAVAAGDPVYAGTTSLSGLLEVEIRWAGADTRLGRLLRLFEEEARRRATVVLLLAVAGVAAFIWAVRSGQMDDLETPGHRVLFDDDAGDSVTAVPRRDKLRADAKIAEPDDVARHGRPPDRRD